MKRGNIMAEQNLIGSFWMNIPPSNPRKGTALLKLGYVIEENKDPNKPYTVLWAEYDQPKQEIEILKRFFELDDTLTEEEMNICHPYHYKDIYMEKMSEKDLRENTELDLVTTAWRPLNFLNAWQEDLLNLINAENNLDSVSETCDFSLYRPHWTQVEAKKDYEEAVKNWSEAQANFIRYWKDKNPVEKDDTFQLLVLEGLVRHPETLKY